ncbi:PAS domain S-box protein [Robertkochia solimangrovi]|uniref:PAS domain S-box protein n=1 Tax=Robertkochia solimangrovi TaxID=2213046 RepID=UPI00117E6C1F|nr:PAS domain S-box protein [Robertkochia solimangrovi]TRZ44335.1 hybrid sensor histidine kinase/response regulator [Robertkochia solimangrovi]
MPQTDVILENNCNRLFRENTSLIPWLHEDLNYGLWYLETDIPETLWISESFWKFLGYDHISKEERNSTIHLNTGYLNLRRELKELIRKQNTLPDPIKFTFINKEGQKVKLLAVIFYEPELLKKGSILLKFIKSDSTFIKEKKLKKKLSKLKQRNALYEITNTITRVGGWEVDLVNQTILWTKTTREIHEVSPTFVPDVENAIAFYKEGWSRDTISSLFEKAINNGESYDIELKLITAKGREIWVRSIGHPEFEEGKCVRVYGAFQDIDKRKSEEFESQFNKERFQLVFDNSSLGIVLRSISNELLLTNPAFRKIFGMDQSINGMIKNQTFRDLIHPDDREMMQNYHRQLLSGEIESYSSECRFFDLTGKLIWCRVNTSVVNRNEDSDALILSQLEDITIKKKLAARSLENSKRFSGAFEYSPNGMALVSLEGRWLMVNNALGKMFGVSKEELLHRSMESLTHPEDANLDEVFIQELLDDSRQSYSIQKRYLHKDGSVIYGLLNVSLIRDHDGSPLYYIGQINDISRRVRSQEELQNSLSELQGLLNATTHVSIIETDLNGIARKFNKGAENLLGYKASEIVDKKPVSIFHDPDEIEERGKELTTQYNRPVSGFEVFVHKANKREFESREWTYIRKNGERFPVQLVATAVVNSKDEITGYLGVATDISQLKEMEVSLVKAKQKAETANRSKSEFLANMSHEIRTPLNGIIGFTDLLMKTTLSESQEHYMQTVYNSANHLLDIINDVLDFSKIEAGKLELNIEKIDLLELCSQTMDIIKHQAHAKSLEVLLDIPPLIDRFIYADTVRLRQILTNLLGNAVKFTEEGEVEMKIRHDKLEQQEGFNRFTFSIRDTGVGIAPHNLSKIFRAFDQEDSSTTRKYGGTGLGLTISNRLLELMGSKLEVTSEPGKGSVFSFTIDFRSEKGISTAKKPGFIKVQKVLVVDDNDHNKSILSEMLQVKKIEVITASNGIEALEILENSSQFDLMIIDYNMPYMNGIEVVKHIRETFNIHKDLLPVMLLHSSVEDTIINKACKELDIQFNITKPISIRQLCTTVDMIERPPKQMDDKIYEVTNQTSLNDVACNVLIAEDNPVNKLLARTLIQKLVPLATIIEADDGAIAVEKFLENKIDIIFMDIQMPVMSGIEATRKIRSLENGTSRVPIVALTARSIKGEKEKSITYGMDEYLSKPVIFETIRQTLIRFLIKEPVS